MTDPSLNELKQIASIENYKLILKGTPNSNYIEYETKKDKDKNLSPKEYFVMIKPYLKDIINNHKTRLFLLKILKKLLLCIQGVLT